MHLHPKLYGVVLFGLLAIASVSTLYDTVFLGRGPEGAAGMILPTAAWASALVFGAVFRPREKGNGLQYPSE